MLLLIASILLLVLGFYDDEQKFNLNFKDTYFVISSLDFYWLFSILTLLLGLIYIIFEKFNVVLFSILSKIHIYGTLILLLLFFYYSYKNSIIENHKNFEELLNQTDYNSYMIITLIVIVFLQLLLLMNIFASTIKHIRVFVAKNKINE